MVRVLGDLSARPVDFAAGKIRKGRGFGGVRTRAGARSEHAAAEKRKRSWSALITSPDIKSLVSHNFVLAVFDVFDLRVLRPLRTPFEKLAQRAFFALNLNVDRPVRLVTGKAGKAKPGCHLPGGVAEKDSLYLARSPNYVALHTSMIHGAGSAAPVNYGIVRPAFSIKEPLWNPRRIVRRQ